MKGSPIERLPVPTDPFQGRGECRHIGHEMCDVLNETNETLNLVLRTRSSPLEYAFHFVGVGMESMVIYSMTKTIHVFRVHVELGSTDE
jgi:hypothetical protein